MWIRASQIGSALRDVALCFVFFTRLPMPRLDFGGRGLGEAIWAAPVVGAGVALLGAAVFAGAHAVHVPTPVAAGLALAAVMAATGCLHEDGLCDVADGFGGGRDRDRKLEIMRDSRIGAYGAAALLLSVGLRWSGLASIGDPDDVLTALLAAHIASRALLPAFLAWTPPARSDGLGAGVGAIETRQVLIAALIGSLALSTLGFAAFTASVGILIAIFILFRALCMRQIGGSTGDTAGALQQAGEIAVIVVASTVLP